MESLQGLSQYELEIILENAFEANDFTTVEMILEQLAKLFLEQQKKELYLEQQEKELCLEQQEKQPSKKKRRQTRRISIPFLQSLTPIPE